MSADASPAPRPKRSFASMAPDRVSQIAAMGGRAIPAEKRAFSQNRDLASAAGRKGGAARKTERQP